MFTYSLHADCLSHYLQLMHAVTFVHGLIVEQRILVPHMLIRKCN